MASYGPPPTSATSGLETPDPYGYNSSASSTAYPPQPSTAPVPVDDYDAEYEEDEPDVVTGVRKPQRRIVLSKRTYMLFAFIIVTGLGIGAIVIAFQKIREHDIPPTPFSSEAFENTLIALFAITAVTPIGFIILKFRIATLSIGFIYMFCLVLCIFFSSKAISRSYLSLKYDTDKSIHQHAVSQQTERKLHNFWSVHQMNHKCCGTKDIDRSEDWPFILNSVNLPPSCCKEEYLDLLKSLYGDLIGQQKDLLANIYRSCAKGLGRTRTRKLDERLKAKRMFSGFFLSLTDRQRDNLVLKFHIGLPQNYDVKQLDVKLKTIQDYTADEAFRKTWKIFYVDKIWNSVADVNHFNDETHINEAYAAHREEYLRNDIVNTTDIDHNIPAEVVGVIKDGKTARETCVNKTGKLRAGQKGSEQFCEDNIPERRRAVNTLGRELLLRLDYLTSYIYEMAVDNSDDKTKGKLKNGSWILWKVPTVKDCNKIYPYQLAANLFRASEPCNGGSDARLKKMYYLSRGIAENIMLFYAIHDKVCEAVSDEPEYRTSRETKLARDLNKRWRRYGSVSTWKNPEEGLGLWLLTFLQEIVYSCIIVASACVLCVIIIAVIFWQYYSRIKAEEYANLALPKEFEVLHLRRGSLIDEAEVTEVPKRRRRVAPRGNRVGPGPGPAGNNVHPQNRQLTPHQRTHHAPQAHHAHVAHAPTGQYGHAPQGQYGRAPPGQYGHAPPPPPGQYGNPPPGQYGNPPPGQYGNPPPGQYGNPPPGQYGYGPPPPPGQYGNAPPGQYGRAPPGRGAPGGHTPRH